MILYFTVASFTYHFAFDKKYLKHPKFLANQIRREIFFSMNSIPIMACFTTPLLIAQVRGHSKLYIDPHQHGWWYLIFQFPLFLITTDFSVYWIHRAFHLPMLYMRFHKPHHQWILTTPFASHAIHPVDGYVQVFSTLNFVHRSLFPFTYFLSYYLCKSTTMCFYSYLSIFGLLWFMTEDIQRLIP